MHILGQAFLYFLSKKLVLGILVFKNYMGRKYMNKGERNTVGVVC